MSKFTITNDGLRELPDDTRDFSLGGVFGFTKIEDVPVTDFVVATPLVIKDQGDTDLCSSYTVTAVSEDQENIELLPEYQFYSTKRISGDFSAWGANLRDACKSATEYGSLPVSSFPHMKGQSRDYILKKENWDPAADMIAKMYRKSTFFAVTGQYDLFDNIRCALWQHKEKKNTIVTGALWKNGWIPAVRGIIPNIGGDGFGHAFKIFGQKVIDGELFLVAQLSNGTQVGDNGLYYFSREVANRELSKYGVYMFKDITREEAEYYLSKPYTKNTDIFTKLLYIIRGFLMSK